MSTVSCPKGCKANGNTVYGSGVYTSDSPICKAAIHAGIITDAGGQFKLYFAPGRSSYTGMWRPATITCALRPFLSLPLLHGTHHSLCSRAAATTRNGITTRSYGAWRSSFKFAGPALGPRVDCAKTNAARDVVGVGPTLAYNRTKLTLSCPAGCLAQGGSVYGTGELVCVCGGAGGRAAAWEDRHLCPCSSFAFPYRQCETPGCSPAGAYTADSRICLAAIHAGVITNSGG